MARDLAGRLVSGLVCMTAGIAIIGAACSGRRAYEFEAPGLTVRVDGAGSISRIAWTGPELSRQVKAFTSLKGCETDGRVDVVRDGDAVAFRRTWTLAATSQSCRVTDRFSRGQGSVRWDVEIVGLEGTWTTPIETWLIYPAGEGTKVWTAWGDPRLSGIVTPDASGSWSDPLVPIRFVDETIWYGAPPYEYDKPRIGFIPFQGNLFGIPLVTVSEAEKDRGLSLVLSPEDTILELSLRTRASGEMVFSRDCHRISPDRPVRFRMDLVGHESGWRGGLRWMTANFPGFFDPNVPSAHDIAGTGAYSSLERPFDLEKMRGMAFGVNWKASFDFPYMGMFIPPVESETTRWTRYGGDTTSIKAMSDYATWMKAQGFHVLSYFNVTEFGADITDPPPPRKTAKDEDLWRSADDFLYGRLAGAILRVPAAVPEAKIPLYRRSRRGGPYFTWGDGIILDPGEPVYREFLLDQAARHIRAIPDAEGICIDRMDWLRMYNEDRDDGVSWIAGRPARSLLVSWQGLLDRLGPLMHQAGKAIFVNNHDKRIDLLRQTDGFFDEFTYGGSPLNLTALMGLRRPVLGWTAEENNLRPDPDAFFQRYLLLGVYPMAPFPGNDHSLLPSEWVDRQYLDYGPLLRPLKGKQWVLEPHCVEAVGGTAKVNLFEVPDGWVVPVTFGPKEGTVEVVLRNVPGLAAGLPAEALYPGSEKAETVALITAGGETRMTVGTQRGCAVVRILRTAASTARAAGAADPDIPSLNRLLPLRDKVRDIHPAFAKLYAVAVAKDKTLRVYLPDEAAKTYVLSKTVPEPFPIPTGIRAAFPLEALGGEPACVVTPEVFGQADGLIFILHEFVHCAQWATVEPKLKETLGLYRKAMETKDYSWELQHAFPYEDLRFVSTYAALLDAIEAGDGTYVQKGRDELAFLLSPDDFDYMTWEEWKEGLARHLENAVRARLGLPANNGGLERPYTRVTFYAGGDRLIGFLAKSDPAVPADMEKTFRAIRYAR